ncbi:uncharacterized protein [Clytia hemisphaerica]|uniref:uncharacterized protein isoform X2 n=1 Tax=Clytia hemisphaerica TaxID=252671 RepID=UPI0034D455FE
MLAERLFFSILMFLTTPPGTPTSEDTGTRKKKCPGCQRSHDLHDFGHPSKNCQGPPPPPSPSSPSTRNRRSSAENTRKSPDSRPFSTEQMDHYRQHLQDLKNQETELLESIRRDKENQLREEENVLIEEIKRQTEKLQRLKDSRSQQHSSRSAPPPETRNSSSGENLTAQSAILNNFPADSMSTLLHRPLLSSQQQQQQTLNPGSSFGNVLPFLNSGSTAEPSSTRQFTQNELFLRPTRTNDVTRVQK